MPLAQLPPALAALLYFALAVLLVSDLALSGLVFVLFSRPEAVLGLLARAVGVREGWRQGRLTEAEEDELLAMGGRLRWPLLAAVFAWSFVCGAVLSWSRM
jgi:hypothetical protein